jgi:hypothetical protein
MDPFEETTRQLINDLTERARKIDSLYKYVDDDSPMAETLSNAEDHIYMAVELLEDLI